MIYVDKKNFDPGQIYDSGQCFRMRPLSGKEYEVIAGNRRLLLCEEEEKIRMDCEHGEEEAFWSAYFDLDTDYCRFIDAVNPKDTYLVNAVKEAEGVRILRQDLWEMIVTFLISQQNNIKRIHYCIDLLCETYGERIATKDGSFYYGFPSPEAFAGLEADALKACNLGYRSKYVIESARQIRSKEVDLEQIGKLSYTKARKELLNLYGVGEKVADCICLFSLHHLDAFPVDTHIRQVLDTHYRRGFPNRRYKGFRGVMQQYIFYHELHGGKKQ